MGRFFKIVLALFLTCTALSPAKAIVVPLDSSVASGVVPGSTPFSGSINGQTLENALNSNVFSVLNTTIEFGATDGGTSSVDHMQFEGPGLVFITGFGFIVRFDAAVSDVRVQFSNQKDDATLTMYAFDSHVDYVRSSTANNQHVQGNPLNFPTLGDAIDSETGTLPPGNNTGTLDLSVSDPSAGIFSILVRSSHFLTNVTEIEFDTSSASVSAPGALAIFTVGMIGLFGIRRRQG